MKKILALLLFVFFTSLSYSQGHTTKELIGSWIGIDSSGKSGNLKFIDSVNIIVVIPDQGTYHATYTIDLKKDPMWFDIILTMNENKVILKGLLQFANPDELKWQLTYDKERSNGFLPESEDVIILDRQ